VRRVELLVRPATVAGGGGVLVRRVVRNLLAPTEPVPEEEIVCRLPPISSHVGACRFLQLDELSDHFILTRWSKPGCRRVPVGLWTLAEVLEAGVASLGSESRLRVDHPQV
jgi:hypothetical protein